MGCNRLCTPEDREAADLARSSNMSFREAKQHIIAEKVRAAFDQLAAADRQAAVQQIMAAREAAQKAAGYAFTMINRPDAPLPQNMKGNFGEGATAINMFHRGYEPVAFGGQGDTGIDSIWMSREGRYVVVESKYNKSTYGFAKNNLFPDPPLGYSEPAKIRQDTPEWTMARVGAALGGSDSPIYRDMMNKGFDYAESRSYSDGTIKYTERRTDYPM